MNEGITKADVDQVKSIAGDYREINHDKDGFYRLAGKAIEIGIFLLIRALEDTAK